MVGVVGARGATVYGRQAAEWLSRDLAACGVGESSAGWRGGSTVALIGGALLAAVGLLPCWGCGLERNLPRPKTAN
jgi:predicted Rossmann fold nucleotide-binding protein DprA/Smf involved in DNA uptake